MTRTKAGQLFKVAAAAYKRGEHDCAKEICVLAFESEDIEDWVRGSSAEVNTEAQLKASLEEAVNKGDLATADAVLQKLSNLGSSESTAYMDDDLDLDDLDDIDDELDDLDDFDDDVYASNDDDSEGSLAYLNDSQVASVLKVAARIKKAGHEDLSKKITDKLGL